MGGASVYLSNYALVGAALRSSSLGNVTRVSEFNFVKMVKKLRTREIRARNANETNRSSFKIKVIENTTTAKGDVLLRFALQMGKEKG